MINFLYNFRDRRPSPEEQMERASIASSRQIERHTRLLQEFIDSAGKRVSPEILQAANQGINDLRFGTNDAQLKFRFMGKYGDDANNSTDRLGSVPAGDLTPDLEDTKTESWVDQFDREMTGTTGMIAIARNPSSFHRDSSDSENLKDQLKGLRFESKTSSEPILESEYPSMEDSGLYAKKSIGARIKLAFTEPKWFMAKIGFPKIAYKEALKLKLMDDIAARFGQRMIHLIN